MENTLTAYNEQVRKFTAAPTAKARTAKITRLAMFMANFAGVFEKAFTASRKAVLDEIIYKTTEAGVYSAKRETIAANCEVSTRTVDRAVAELKKTNEYVIARTANGRAGAYIFVDRKHEQFAEIMIGLFGEENAAKFTEAKLEANDVASQQNGENAVTETAEAAKTEEPTVLPALNAFKQEPKNLNNGPELNNADKSEERPTAIYVRLSEVLAEMFGKNEMKHVMRKLENMRKNMQISDDVAVQAALETAQSNNCRNFFALWSYKIKVALGIIDTAAKATPKATKPLPKAFQPKEDLSPVEEAEQELAELKAKREAWLTSGRGQEWLYVSDIERLESKIAKLRGEEAAEEETPEIDFEEERRKILARLGYDVD